MFSAHSGAQKLSFNWATINAPPFFVYSGDYAHQGICDLLIEELINAMPDAEHHLLALPNLRLKKRMQSGENICLPCMIHQPGKNAGIVYSNPSVVYLPHVLIMKAKTRERFVNEFGNPASLESLLESDKYILGQHSGRKFASDIQTIIDKHLGQGLEVPNEVGSTISLLMLIDLNRVDYTIDYPSTLSYYNKTNSRPLAWLPMQENDTQIVFGAVGCSGPDDGKFQQRAIQRINAVLPDILKKAQYQKRLSFWFEDMDPGYIQKYRENLLK